MLNTTGRKVAQPCTRTRSTRSTAPTKRRRCGRVTGSGVLGPNGIIRDLLAQDGAVTLPCEGARAVYALRIFKPPRRPRATWSSPRRVARGEIELM